MLDDSNPLVRFFAELLATDIDDHTEVLSLDNGANFLDKDGEANEVSKIYIRRCYREAHATITTLISGGTKRIFITGTKGIGKTLFRNVLMRLFLEGDSPSPIIVQSSPGLVCRRFTCVAGNRVVEQGTVSDFLHAGYFDDASTRYLVDVTKDAAQIANCQGITIVFTSPDQNVLKIPNKRTDATHWLDALTFGEALETNRLCECGIADGELKSRFVIYGGSARLLLTSGCQFDEAASKFDDAFSHLSTFSGTYDAWLKDDASRRHHLVHYAQSASGGTPMPVAASPFVESTVQMLLKHYQLRRTADSLVFRAISGLPIGEDFERRYAYELLKLGGEYPARCLEADMVCRCSF